MVKQNTDHKYAEIAIEYKVEMFRIFPFLNLKKQQILNILMDEGQ